MVFTTPLNKHLLHHLPFLEEHHVMESHISCDYDMAYNGRSTLPRESRPDESNIQDSVCR